MHNSQEDLNSEYTDSYKEYPSSVLFKIMKMLERADDDSQILTNAVKLPGLKGLTPQKLMQLIRKRRKSPDNVRNWLVEYFSQKKIQPQSIEKLMTAHEKVSIKEVMKSYETFLKVSGLDEDSAIFRIASQSELPVLYIEMLFKERINKYVQRGLVNTIDRLIEEQILGEKEKPKKAENIEDFLIDATELEKYVHYSENSIERAIFNPSQIVFELILNESLRKKTMEQMKGNYISDIMVKKKFYAISDVLYDSKSTKCILVVNFQDKKLLVRICDLIEKQKENDRGLYSAHAMRFYSRSDIEHMFLIDYSKSSTDIKERLKYKLIHFKNQLYICNISASRVDEEGRIIWVTKKSFDYPARKEANRW